MQRSIRTKFTLWLVGSFLILLLISFGLTEGIYRLFGLKQVDEHLYRNATTFRRALIPCISLNAADMKPASPAVIGECLNRLIQERFPTEVVFTQVSWLPRLQWENNRMLAGSYTMQDQTFPLTPAAAAALFEGSYQFETIPDEAFETEMRLLSLPFSKNQNGVYVLQFAIPTVYKVTGQSGLQAILTFRPHIFFVIFPALLLITLFWGYIFMKKVFSPIHRLSAMARQSRVRPTGRCRLPANGRIPCLY